MFSIGGWKGAAFGAIVIVAGMLLAGIPVSDSLAASTASPASGASAPASSSVAPSNSVAFLANPPVPSESSPGATPASFGPHPGTIEAYEPVPGGATTEDPATAYDTTSYEVILNVYETLVSYNGSSTATFVPTLATCVPGQGDNCATDYGAGFTGIYNATGGNFTGSNGVPTYWTFVIDPAARFYDPSTKASWPVYPTDVMFSIARTLGFSTYPVATKTAGWILAQALLPPGNADWDNGIHAPYNNTPSHILDSMLVNDSAFCPTKAMNGVQGNGCITFVANGSAQDWPEFLDFVEDNLGASVTPCGWFTYESAGIPGWSGTSAAKGDGSCNLPDGGTTTASSTWTSYTSGLSPTAWDSFEELNAKWPAPQPNVQWNMVGSGPYYASVTPGLSYSLAANPAYAQPSGCSGAGGLTAYSGYCDPAPGKYIPNVDVTWETAAEGDSLGTSAIEAGTADFAGIVTAQTSTLLGYVHSGIWDYSVFPTLSNGFTPINFAVDYSAYNTTFSGSPLHANPIPSTLFTDLALRNFYVNAYPYTTIQNTINTVDGVVFSFNAGGPIPENMGNYYPTNVSWPYLRGDPTQSATTVGSAAWWWAQLTTPGSGYYNATLVKTCTSSHPCTWPIGYFDGQPSELTQIDDWAGEIYALSGHALDPWPLALSFTQFLTDTLIDAYESPLVSAVGFGWAPDYPDPTDYLAPIAQPGGDYTGPDTVANQLSLASHNDSATCGHSGTSTEAGAFANLTYWAHQAENPSGSALNSTCEGVAYNVANYWMQVAGALPAGAARVLDYNLVEQILNALALYVYNGQTNELAGFAPWINPASINRNPVIGGGGDSVWYQVQYRSLYNVTVTETGLPSGTSWSATLGNKTLSSTASSIVFPGQPNATYNYSVSYESGFSVSPSNGTAAISGSNVTETVTYTAISLADTSPVTINETGLITNTTWSALVTGYGTQSTNFGDLVFHVANATTYTYAGLPVLGYFTPASGSVVVGAGPANVTVTYKGLFNETYRLLFSETGLPSGLNWSVTFGNSSTAFTQTTASNAIVYTEANGTYNYTISVQGDYASIQPIGAVTVAGSAVTLHIIIEPAYTVTFSETGLGSGASWSIFFNGQEKTTSAPANITFSIVNGSWTFAAYSSGQVASPASSSVGVFGHNESVTVAFSHSSPSWFALSPFAYLMIGVLVALAVAGFALFVFVRPKRKPPAAPPPPPAGASAYPEGLAPASRPDSSLPPSEGPPPGPSAGPPAS
jgi:hypothetical protein